MIGFTDFSSTRSRACLSFNINFQTINGVYGAYMPPSNQIGSYAKFSRFGYTILYMKMWECPVDTFMNSTVDLCETCSIPNCNVCTNLVVCQLCN